MKFQPSHTDISGDEARNGVKRHKAGSLHWQSAGTHDERENGLEGDGQAAQAQGRDCRSLRSFDNGARASMPRAVVLAVGRDPLLLETRRLILQAEGYTVQTTLSLKFAVAQLLNGNFDLVVLCHSISPEDRQHLTSSIREHNSRIPIVSISSGFAERDPFTNATIDNDPAHLVTRLREVLSESDGCFDDRDHHIA